MRVRRLNADAAHIESALASHEAIRIVQRTGNPPEVYGIEYRVKSLQKAADDDPMPAEVHQVEIQLTSDYPRLSPRCRMLSPVFHPNIDETTICIGDHWTAGERLVDLVVRIAEMLAYQAYNVRSPLNAEAAMWADLHPEAFPTDARNFHPAGSDKP